MVGVFGFAFAFVAVVELTSLSPLSLTVDKVGETTTELTLGVGSLTSCSVVVNNVVTAYELVGLGVTAAFDLGSPLGVWKIGANVVKT